MRKDLLKLDSHQQPFRVATGKFSPLGAILDKDKKGCNFSVYSLGAYRVELCLFDHDENEIANYSLDVKQGHQWSVFIHNVQAGQLYGYRVFGDRDPQQGHIFDPDNLLIDPYAKALNRVQNSFDTSQISRLGQHISKSVVVDDEFDWAGVTKPSIEDDQRIIYEVHVKGFSQLNEQVPLAKRGKYLGLSDPASIAHYKKLGITSLQIMPIYSFMSEPRLEALGLTNYWGYNPINFFAPECRYAQYDAVQEFKTMVKELHAAQIEVILDVVYNHTAESGIDGPILSLKGFDNHNYYTFDPDTNSADTLNYQQHSNHSGCGNTVNLNYPWALKLTLDSLRYWATEMQIDGFRFDLAVTLARESNGFNEQGAFFKSLLQDPVLNQVKLIAEPWDIGPGGYRLGGFPADWLECNDRYRDTVRSFWRGDTGKIADIATRLLGSRDIFVKHYRSKYSSVNYICYHDGFTLDDLVSYDQRHNLANEENNNDGHGNNLSANYGVEGETENERINALRQQQKRNLIATLLLSQGTPHFLSGDEMGNHQSGNNNAYCQDNSLTWLNWNLSEVNQKLFDFTASLVKLRQQSRLFGNLSLRDDCLDNCENSDLVKWYHPDGYLMETRDWHSTNSQAIAIALRESVSTGEYWFVILNASSYQIHCKLPPLEKGLIWKVKINTACATGELTNVNININNKDDALLIGNSFMLLKCVRRLV
ncbi:MAG: glycogen debranching protein GlgX [Psychromonas sp.]